VRITDDEALQYVVFFNNLLHRPSYAQILSSAPYSQTSSAYVSPSMWASKVHTLTKQQTKLWFCISWSLNFWIASWKTKHSAPN